MRMIRVVGRKNHGKTTLVLDLIEEFRRRGLRVGAIKHSRHSHEIDAPGKDSFRHRQAGASPAAIMAGNMCGLFFQFEDGVDPYERILPMFADCDVLLIEGHFEYPSPKIEVWRQEGVGTCLAHENSDIIAVVCDDLVDLPVKRWPRGDLKRLADLILAEDAFQCPAPTTIALESAQIDSSVCPKHSQAKEIAR